MSFPPPVINGRGMDIKVEDTGMPVGYKVPSFSTLTLAAVVKEENEVASEDGTSIDTKLESDVSVVRKPENTAFCKQTACSSDREKESNKAPFSSTPDSAVTVKVENEDIPEDALTVPGNTPDLLRIAADERVEIKIEQVDADLADVPAFVEHFSSHKDGNQTMEGNISITKEEDLGVFEEVAETFSSHFSDFINNKDDFAGDDQSLQTLTVCDGANESFSRNFQKAFHCQPSFSEEMLGSKTKKSTANSEFPHNESALSAISPAKCLADLGLIQNDIKFEECPFGESQESRTFYDSLIKLKQVKIVLKDLFPKSERGSSQVHINSKACPCIFCTRKFKVKNKANLLRKTYNGGSVKCKKAGTQENKKLFSCSFCQYKTIRKYTLKVHQRIHSGERPFSCTYCPSKFNQRSGLNTHLMTHTGDKPFTCTYCPSKFHQRGNLNTHLRTHTGDKPFACTYCPSKFRHRNSLDAHLMTHTGEKPFACTYCPFKSRHRHHLNTHLMTHTGEKPFACTYCPSKFRHRNHLNTHLMTHTGDKPFACSYCPSKFNQRCNLNTHLKTHTGDKPFACTYCPSKFRHRQNLNTHLMTHTGEKPFACTYCPSKFRHRNHLNTHLMTHTGDKPFACTYCPSKFRHRQSLNAHLNTHSGEKPFACTYCPSKFSKSSNLTAHRRIHTGDKPFSCAFCPSKFSRKYTLKVHLKTHSSKGKFLCEHCSGSFKTKGRLKRHMINHSY